MADGSQVTLVFELSRLPLLPGAERLAHRPYLTRASATNAAYVQPFLKIDGKPDPVRLEFFYDAQTSGGLLISVAADKAEALVEVLHKRGAASACVVGEVTAKQEAALILKP
jgi:selenide,water dikinase